jgi:hypothetical protein
MEQGLMARKPNAPKARGATRSTSAAKKRGTAPMQSRLKGGKLNVPSPASASKPPAKYPF